MLGLLFSPFLAPSNVPNDPGDARRDFLLSILELAIFDRSLLRIGS